MIRTCMAVAALAALLPAQQGIAWWSKPWSAAFEEARERNVPLLIAFIQDGEEANERIVSGLYTDPGFIKLTGLVIPIIASISVHAPKKEEVRGTTETVCSRFGAVSCARHKEHEVEARTRFFGNQGIPTPHHIIVLPDGTETSRIHDVHPTGVYGEAVRTAQKRLGRGIPAQEYGEARDSLGKIRSAIKEKRYGEAFSRLQELQRISKGTPLEKRATELATALDETAQEELLAIKNAERDEHLVNVLRRLAELGRELKGTPLQKQVVNLEATIKRTAEGREASSILAREDRARPRFDKAQELTVARAYVRAVWEFGRVLKIVDTGPLADETRQRLKAFRNEPAVLEVVREALDEVDAEVATDEASRLLKNDRTKGEAMLQRVIEAWPNTKAAERARKLLERGD